MNHNTDEEEYDEEAELAEHERLQARSKEEKEAEYAKLQAESEKWCAENADKLEF